MCPDVPELVVRPAAPGPLDPLEIPAKLERAAQLALRALEVIRGMPAQPDRPEIAASLDLLGRVVLLVSGVLREHGGPLAKSDLQDPQVIRALRESLGRRDLAERLDLLEFEALLGHKDPLVLQALALLVQRDLLELDPPD